MAPNQVIADQPADASKPGDKDKICKKAGKIQTPPACDGFLINFLRQIFGAPNTKVTTISLLSGNDFDFNHESEKPMQKFEEASPFSRESPAKVTFFIFIKSAALARLLASSAAGRRIRKLKLRD